MAQRILKIEKKNFLTNVIAGLFVLIGFYLPIPYHKLIFTMGCFALSGALTNWIAIYMLFEKVPFLYGSGVILIQFKAFKKAIQELMMTQFFTQENIQKVFTLTQTNSTEVIQKIQEKINKEEIFEKLTEAIMSSSFGGMLSVFGGKQALEPLKDPCVEKIELFLVDFIKKIEFNTIDFSFDQKIEKIISSRLDQLTPEMVKEIIQTMIREHLGWLVVWGGVFGGLLGLIFEVLVSK